MGADGGHHYRCKIKRYRRAQNDLAHLAGIGQGVYPDSH
jgi:hypothetical protein